MARYVPLDLVRVAILVIAAIVVPPVTADAAPAPLDTPGSLAAKASPALVGSLSKEMGSTPEQAAGAAGSRVRRCEVASEAGRVQPGCQGRTRDGGLSSAAGAFSALGLSPSLVAKAIPVLTSFVSKSGGASTGALLASVLK